VHITGTGMNAVTSYDIVVVRPDGSVVTGLVAPVDPPAAYDYAVTDSNGTFTFNYLLTNMQGFYTVNVYRSADTAHLTLVATTTFEDAIVVNMDQCANGAPKFGDLHCDWQNGNINNSNSQYAEGESIPYRYDFSGMNGIPAPFTRSTFSTTSPTAHQGVRFPYLVQRRKPELIPARAAPRLKPVSGLPPRRRSAYLPDRRVPRADAQRLGRRDRRRPPALPGGLQRHLGLCDRHRAGACSVYVRPDQRDGDVPRDVQEFRKYGPVRMGRTPGAQRILGHRHGCIVYLRRAIPHAGDAA
jgi:hypothetical protein